MGVGLILTASHERWPLARPFSIAHGTRTHADVVLATVKCDGLSGRGEGVPYPRYGESVPEVIAALNQAGQAISTDDTAGSLGLKGAAASALDAALWDLRSQREGRSINQLCGWPALRPLTTAYTISIGTPAEMRERAREESTRPLLKIKTGRDQIIPCVEAVREGAPEAQLIVDANESWPESELADLCRAMHDLGVAMVEQPLPSGGDEALGRFEHLVPIFADESFHSAADIAHCARFYDGVNIKLDKTGGLTPALQALDAARAAKLRIMCGCMVGTSLAMAPAFLLAQQAEFTDLDAPLLLAKDRPGGFRFEGSTMFPLEQPFWGNPHSVPSI